MKYLGIDGGGSKTTFLLVDDREQELFRAQTGPSNWTSVGPDAAGAAIREGLSKLPEVPGAVCGGFAGAGRAEAAEFYRSVIEAALPSAAVRIVSDAHAAYFGAIGAGPGVLLIAGTGSIAVGRTPEGSMIRAGGWGPHFGDEGSGYWIGRAAVQAALRSVDAGESREFALRIAGRLGVNQIGDVVTAWTKGVIGVPQIAGLFPEVVACYPAEPAATILTQAANHLRSLVEVAVSRVASTSCPRSVVGSVANHPLMRTLIGIEFAEPLHPPEWGAAILAARGAGL
jgi:N-acetylglucosamine kinase-like BadF-type ATPase